MELQTLDFLHFLLLRCLTRQRYMGPQGSACHTPRGVYDQVLAWGEDDGVYSKVLVLPAASSTKDGLVSSAFLSTAASCLAKEGLLTWSSDRLAYCPVPSNIALLT